MPSANTGTGSRPKIERSWMPWFAAQLLPSSLPAMEPPEPDDTLLIGWSRIVTMKISRLSIFLSSIAVLTVLRRVSTTLRQSVKEFTEYRRLLLLVC